MLRMSDDVSKENQSVLCTGFRCPLRDGDLLNPWSWYTTEISSESEILQKWVLSINKRSYILYVYVDVSDEFWRLFYDSDTIQIPMTEGLNVCEDLDLYDSTRIFMIIIIQEWVNYENMIRFRDKKSHIMKYIRWVLGQLGMNNNDYS